MQVNNHHDTAAAQADPSLKNTQGDNAGVASRRDNEDFQQQLQNQQGQAGKKAVNKPALALVEGGTATAVAGNEEGAPAKAGIASPEVEEVNLKLVQAVIDQNGSEMAKVMVGMAQREAEETGGTVNSRKMHEMLNNKLLDSNEGLADDYSESMEKALTKAEDKTGKDLSKMMGFKGKDDTSMLQDIGQAAMDFLKNPWVDGTMQIVGGVSQAVTGTACVGTLSVGAVVTAPTVVGSAVSAAGAAGCTAVALHGVDQAIAGVKTMWNGEHAPSVVNNVLQLTMSEEWAGYTEALFSVGGTARAAYVTAGNMTNLIANGTQAGAKTATSAAGTEAGTVATTTAAALKSGKHSADEVLSASKDFVKSFSSMAKNMIQEQGMLREMTVKRKAMLDELKEVMDSGELEVFADVVAKTNKLLAGGRDEAVHSLIHKVDDMLAGGGDKLVAAASKEAQAMAASKYTKNIMGAIDDPLGTAVDSAKGSIKWLNPFSVGENLDEVKDAAQYANSVRKLLDHSNDLRRLMDEKGIVGDLEKLTGLDKSDILKSVTEFATTKRADVMALTESLEKIDQQRLGRVLQETLAMRKDVELASSLIDDVVAMERSLYRLQQVMPDTPPIDAVKAVLMSNVYQAGVEATE